MEEKPTMEKDKYAKLEAPKFTPSNTNAKDLRIERLPQTDKRTNRKVNLCRCWKDGLPVSFSTRKPIIIGIPI